MIGQIKGIVCRYTPPNLLLVDVQGVGYEMQVPSNLFDRIPKVGESICLATHLLVRDDRHELYAFSSTRERDMFRELIRINSIGAKIALAMLSCVGVHALIDAVKREDFEKLKSIPGLGIKTAKRVTLELRDRLILKENTGRPLSSKELSWTPRTTTSQEVFGALLSLGYKHANARRMIEKVPLSETMDTQQLLKEALKLRK